MTLRLLLALALTAQPTQRLQFERGASAQACPDEAALRRAVAERLGKDPFTDDGQRTVRVSFDATDAGLSADVQLADPTGAVQGNRRLVSPQLDCAELAQSTALAVSIVVDPLVLTRPPSPTVDAGSPPPPTPTEPTVAAPPPRRPVEPVAPRPVEPPPPPPKSTEADVFVFGALGVDLFSAPSVTLRADVDATWDGPWWRAGLGLTSTGPGVLPVMRGDVAAWKVTAGPHACLKTGAVGVCASARFGVLHSWASNLPAARGVSTPSVQLGAVPYVELSPGPVVRLRFQAGVLVDPLPTWLEVGAAEVWRTPWVSLFFGLAVGFRAVDGRLP